LGVGFKPMLERDLAWVIIRLKFKLYADAEMHSTVRVKTWPLPVSGVCFRRDYTITAENGTLLAEGTSDWVLMHTVKRRMVPCKELYPLTQFCTDRVVEEKLGRVHDFDSEAPVASITPGFTTLDINDHVNNIHYADFALDALNPTCDELIDTFQIDYHRELRVNSVLELHISRADKECLIKGTAEDQTVFLCRITFC
jgi:acyl-ACP thioesterase